jgi:MFS transporter, DHA1 family, tetracycline resistance protein
MMASNALARIIAPPLFGFVYASVSPDAPYFLGALMIGGAVLVAFQVKAIRDQAT